jgi:hypothetical protein
MYARKSDVVSLREAAVELMAAPGHQQEVRETIEPQLIQLNCRWGEILHRIHVSNGVHGINQLYVDTSVSMGI